MTSTFNEPTAVFPGGYTPTEAILMSERVLAGAAISRRDLAETAAETVKPEHFHQLDCAAAYRAALRLVDAGQWVDPAAVARQLEQSGEMRLFGQDIGRIVDLAAHGVVGGPDGVRWHAYEVTSDATRRKLHQAGMRIVQTSSSPEFRLDRDVDFAMGEVQAASEGVEEQELGWVSDDFDAWADQAGTRPEASVLLPWKDLNEQITLRGGQMVVVGARPGNGKSLIGIGAAQAIAIDQNKPAAIFSLEMGRSEIYERIAAFRAKVLLERFTKPNPGGLSDGERKALDKIRPDLRAAPLLIDDSPAITPQRIRARLRWMAGQGKPAKVAIVDYLQLMEANERFENRQQEVAYLSRQMKLIAKQFDIPVIALSQLNRGPENRAEPRPKASDLRESGGLEQDADVVLLLHRERDEEGGYSGTGAGQLEVHIAKNRGGSSGLMRALAWRAHYGTLSDMAQL
jgi:replicative DNA helicase